MPIFSEKMEFFGRVVSENSIAMSDLDIQTVKNWPTPRCSKNVGRFARLAGLANYHRGFVKHFSKLASPLYQVVGKNKFR